jgi:predicted transcriptional regulator with HTH domain
MSTELTTLLRSLRRSAVRTRVLVALFHHGELHAGLLADIAAIDAPRLRWALDGYPKRYATSLGLLRLGLVEELRVREELRYRTTSLGRAVAARVLDDRRRRETPMQVS